MKRKIVPWRAEELFANRQLIQYPDFQREPTVWTKRKKQLLIDSMLIGLDIPKIYLYSPENDQYCRFVGTEKVRFYDCVDGQQRIVSVVNFFSGYLELEDGRFWKDLSESEKTNLLNYEFTIALITEATDDQLRILFLRLQLGAPLNVGEKLHAMKGGLRDFVFDIGKNHPFFAESALQDRRFYRETVFAEICLNSFYRSLYKTFYTARYEELKTFFEQYADIDKYPAEKERILHTLDLMHKYFDKCIEEFRSRAVVLTGYLFFEELYKMGEMGKLPLFAEFYEKFLSKLSEQSRKGLDYDMEYRELLDFQNYVIQAAVSRSSIMARHEIVSKFFEHYLKNKQIKTTS
jgi:hypothetical protein